MFDLSGLPSPFITVPATFTLLFTDEQTVSHVRQPVHLVKSTNMALTVEGPETRAAINPMPLNMARAPAPAATFLTNALLECNLFSDISC
jgi:hypothetical protein